MPPKTNSHTPEDRVTVRMDVHETVRENAKIVAVRSKSNVQWVYGSLAGLGLDFLDAIGVADMRSEDIQKILRELRERRKPQK